MKAFAALLLWGLSLLVSATAATSDDGISTMLERVLPAVVTVAVEKSTATKTPYGFTGNTVSEAYLKTLDLSGADSIGSGFVIRHDNHLYVITNAHVIEQAAGDGAVFVYGIDQTRYPIRIVGADSFYDIAVLAFQDKPSPSKMGSVSFKPDPPRLGERVFAIGNPLGDYPYSVSDGIISGLNRVLGGLTGKFGYLQSTATLSGGNSGGPLVDTAGHVIGINTSQRIAYRNHQYQLQSQINFALEAGLASRLVTDILTHDGRVRRAFFGLEITQYNPTGKTEAPKSPSPILTGVLPDSPAANALANQTGQAVVAINGVSIRNLEEVQGALEMLRPGDTMTLTLETRHGQRADYSVASDELSRERLAALGRYFFEKKGGGRAGEEKGRVVIQWIPDATVSQAGQEAPKGNTATVANLAFDRQLRQFLQAIIDPAPPKSVTVVGAGIANSEFWQVSSLADLGIVIRLAARQGWIDLISQESKGDALVRVTIPAHPNTMACTLFY